MSEPDAISQSGAKTMVLVGTPAYGGMVHTDHLRCLFDFIREGIGFRYFSIGNESLITRARNAIAASFHAKPEFTHLLFLDADVHLPVDGLRRMLDAGVPVVGAPVALKGLDAAGNRTWNIGRSMGSRGALFRVEHVGTAALLFSRDAIDALVQDAIADSRVYERNTAGTNDFDAPLQYDVFRAGVQNSVYLSEDFWVCRRLRQLGFDVCIDPTIVTTHHGIIAV